MRAGAGGWLVWAALAAAAWALPGRAWRPVSPPEFLAAQVLPFLLTAGLLALAAPAWVARGGPGLARSRPLAALEAPPPLLWGLGLLVLWPAAWGPPGLVGWTLALGLALVPTELRWLAQALPAERPFPSAWGPAATRLGRRGALVALAPRWLAARLPVWLMAGLVLERVLGVPGPGGDWVARVAARDRPGMVLWVAALAALWALARRAR